MNLPERLESPPPPAERPPLASRVCAVDPNGGRCLLRNVLELDGEQVDFVHCFTHKAAKKKLITSLEWHWNIPRNSLNLDTRYNVFPVHPHLRELFAQSPLKGSWILIPEDHIIERYHASIVYTYLAWEAPRKDFPVIEDGVFWYRFMPLIPKDSGNGIFGALIPSQDVPSREDSDSEDGIKTHTYPFDSLPLVKSHLHPRFVILDVARKLNRLYSRGLVEDLVLQDIRLMKIGQIWSAWSTPCPSRQFIKDGRSKHDDADTKSVDSAKFTPPPTRRRRQSSSEQPNGPVRKKRMPRRFALSKNKLKEHSRSVGSGSWNAAAVSEWLEHCLPFDQVPEPLGTETPDLE